MKIQKHQIYAFVEIARCILAFVLAEVSPWVLEHHQDQEGQTLTLQKAGKKFSRLCPQYPPHVEAGKTQSQSQKRSGESPRDFYQPCSWGLCLCGF